MIHRFSETSHAVNELDSLREVFENVESGYLSSSNLPAPDTGQLSFDLSRIESQHDFPVAQGVEFVDLDFCVDVLGLRSPTRDFLIDLPE